MSDTVIQLDIKKPLWDKRKVGIADFRVKKDGLVYMTISYTVADGKKLYPYTYIMEASKIREYPVMTIKNGIKLHIVPINDFEIKENQING